MIDAAVVPGRIDQDHVVIERVEGVALQPRRMVNQLAVAAQLYEQSLWVGAIRPPTVPAGSARLRVTLSAGHTAQEVAQLINAINTLERTRHEP